MIQKSKGQKKIRISFTSREWLDIQSACTDAAIKWSDKAIESGSETQRSIAEGFRRMVEKVRSERKKAVK